MRIYFSTFLTLLFLLSGIDRSTQAQAIHQTVTKNISQNITVSPSTVFSVNAEKASIVVTGWNNNYIQIRLSFFASHPDKKIALQELTYMQYAIAKEKDLVELRNIFKLPTAIDHIQSRLEIKMELMVPAKNKLQITNKYGDISITQLSGNIDVNISFGDLHFIDITGNVEIAANYSDIRGSRISAASLRCTDEKSKISLDLDKGDYFFFSKHGDIDLNVKKINTLTIKSNRSDITIRPQDMDACRYKIANTDGTLYLPEKYSGRIIKKGNQTLFTTTGSPSMPLLAVTATFNSVTIK
jgi:hypothetical protein